MTMKKDKFGYLRMPKHSNAWHRKVAYYKIYLKNPEKYPLPFSEYEIHHKDGDKTNNHPDNLEILSPEEHIDKHLEMEESEKIHYRNDYDYLVQLASKKSGFSAYELDLMAEKKIEKLSRLTDKKGALHIVLAELGIEI